MSAVRVGVGVGVILLLFSSCLSLLDAQQITHPLDGIYISLSSVYMCALTLWQWWMMLINEVFWVAVSALHAVHRKLKDPMDHLQDWKKTDPCASNWTGVFCIADPSDGFLHVQELYVGTFYTFVVNQYLELRISDAVLVWSNDAGGCLTWTSPENWHLNSAV